jgi:hypothetical protein
MSDQVRRTVAQSLLILWVILFGLYASEELGLLPDTSEALDQAVTQTLSMPAEHVVYTSDVSAVVMPVVGVGTAIRGDAHIPPPTDGGRLLPDTLQPHVRSKLFQFYSVYRI